MGTEDVVLRVLEPALAEVLIGTDVFDFPARPDQVERFVNDPGHVMVLALAGRQVVGFVSGTVLLHPDKAPGLFVNEIELRPEWRRQGLGQRLLTAIRTQARGLGCETVWLATEGDNVPARALYRKAGGAEQTGVVVYEWPEVP